MQNGLNKSELLEKVFGEESLLVEIIDMFWEMSTDMVAKIEKAIRDGDAEALMKTAHLLKGSIGNFSQGNAFAGAFELEKMGRSAQLDGAQAVFEVMNKDIDSLKQALMEIKDQLTI